LLGIVEGLWCCRAVPPKALGISLGYMASIYFWAFMPLIDRLVKSGTGDEREKRWGVDRRNDIGPDSRVSSMGVKPECGWGYCLRHSAPPYQDFLNHNLASSAKKLKLGHCWTMIQNTYACQQQQ